MKIHGSYDSSQSRQDVYGYLTDPRRMLSSFPHVTLSDVTEDGFTAHANVGVGPITQSVEVQIQIAQREEDRSAEYRGQGHGFGSNLDLDASFQLADRQGQPGTHVEWSGEATIDGPLGSMADGAFEGVVQQDIQNMLKSLDRSTAANEPPVAG